MSESKKLTREEIERLMETNPWWKELSDELDRVLMVHRLTGVVDDAEKAENINVMFEHTLITHAKLQAAQSDMAFVEARDIIQSLSAGESFPARLVELYESKKPEALDEINHSYLRLIPLVSDNEGREELELMWQTDRSRLVSLDANDLPDKLKKIRGSTQRYILRSIMELAKIDERIRNHRDYPFSNEIYIPAEAEKTEQGEIKVALGQGKERINHLAYRVYDPLWDQGTEHFETNYIDFPLRWAGDLLSISEMARLYDEYKSGKNVLAGILPLYQTGDRLSRLRNAIGSCPITSAYGELFDEVIESFLDKRFKVSSTSLLALVEGLLWEFAWWWNSVHGGLFDRPLTHAQYREGAEFELLKKDGTRVGGRANIGDLLRKTKFGEDIYVETVEYLIEDLFGERNPVLHGRRPSYGSDEKAAALLFVVETIERQITDALKKQLGKEFLKHMPPAESADTEENGGGDA